MDTPRKPIRPALALLVFVLLIAAACGSDTDDSSVAAGGDEPIPVDDASVPGDDNEDEGVMPTPDGETDFPDVSTTPDEPVTSVGLPTDEWLPLTGSTDMIDPVVGEIVEVVTNDDGTLGVRFWTGSEPCSVANVFVAETVADVYLRLDLGLHPNVAAMSCVNMAVAYEITVTLDEPVGDREVVIEAPADNGDDLGLPPVDQFVGLTLADAEALAATEARPFRIGSQDGEFFALTEDWLPERVTVDVVGGIVTAASAG